MVYLSQGQYTAQSSSQMAGMEELSVTKHTLVSISDLSLPEKLLIYIPPDALDGAMVTIAMYTMNIAHPGILLALSPNKQVDTTLSA